MSLVILNAELATLLARDVITTLQRTLDAEIMKLLSGDGNARKISDLCTEITNISRQIEEQTKKKPKLVEVKF